MMTMVANIAEAFEQSAARQGDKIGLIESWSGRQCTFSELCELADGYAGYFSKQGVRPQDRVMLMVTPSADFISLTFGLFKLGATIILIDPGMGYKNLLRCIESVAPTVLVGIPKAHLFSRIFYKTFRTIKRRFCCGPSYGFFGKDIRQAVKDSSGLSEIYSPQQDDLAAIIFTTGSTGPPKGVRYEHSIFAAQLNRIQDYYGIDSSHVDQPAFPLFALFSAALGACSVLPDMNPSKPASVDPEKFVNSIKKYKVSYSFGSPAIWNVVSNYCLEKGIVLKSVQKILMAGAPVPGDLLERVTRILPPDAQIFTPYGATESLPIVSIEGKEILEDTWKLTQQGKGTCVGRPLPGIELEIIPIEDGPIGSYSRELQLPPNEIGEIIVKGDVVTRSYEQNAAETTLSKIRDNGSVWHRMGDTGYLDEQGRLWFCGRKAHRVVTNEGTLFTIPCEAITNAHPEVYRSALVGIPQDSGSAAFRPVMVIEPMKNFQGSEKLLLQQVQSLAAAHPLTKEIDAFLVHPDFPVDIRHNAKIFREQLAVWAAQRMVNEQ